MRELILGAIAGILLVFAGVQSLLLSHTREQLESERQQFEQIMKEKDIGYIKLSQQFSNYIRHTEREKKECCECPTVKLSP